MFFAKDFQVFGAGRLSRVAVKMFRQDPDDQDYSQHSPSNGMN